MRTLRRLNDPERYYGLSWRGWIGAGAGGGVLYGAIRVSPLGTRPTITIVVLVLAFCGVALHALSGPALGPGRHLLALARYRFGAKHLRVPDQPKRGGLVISGVSATAPTIAGDPQAVESSG